MSLIKKYWWVIVIFAVVFVWHQRQTKAAEAANLQ
jgi:hypothetical protein